MGTNETRSRLEADLSQSIDELQQSLQRAADATASIRNTLPRLASITSLFDELDSVIRTGRAQLGATDAPASYSRPTLVPSATPTPAPDMKAGDPWHEVATAWSPEPATTDASPTEATTASDNGDASTTIATETPAASSSDTAPHCFRLEFESRSGPLDLRSVDDAVSEHPAVRDVALLDYDGRTATLKVWIDPTASPSDVQSALVARSTELFGETNDVTIVALEEAA